MGFKLTYISENIMDGSVNPSEVATLSLLGGGGGGGLFNRGQFADDGSNAVRINGNRHLNTQGHDFLSQQVSDNADRNRDITSNIQLNTSFERMSDKITDQTRFFQSRVDMLAAEQVQNAKDAAKCCCEAKLLAVENHAVLLAGQATIVGKLELNEAVTAAVAATRNTVLLEQIAANGNGNGHGRG